MNEKYIPLWDKCVAFHGHSCGGLAIGFQAALYARELLDCPDRAADEELVCVAENDACGVDAIQALLGCTVGKGNMLFSMQGKQAFSFYRRDNGRSVRLVLRATPGMDRQQRHDWLMDGDYHDLFDVKEAPAPMPERARIFRSYPCAVCGETVAESHARLQNGEIVCLACWRDYTRGL